jgi:hypothetical protein
MAKQQVDNQVVHCSAMNVLKASQSLLVHAWITR